MPFRFGCDDNGNYGYILTEGGADTVVPFKGIIEDGTIQGTGAQTYFNAEVGRCYLVCINTIPQTQQPLVTSGADILVHGYDNYGGRQMMLEIVKATSTIVNVRVQYVLYYKLT